MHLSVIIPAYNEGERIGPTLDLLNDYLSKQSYDYEIVVVTDGSKKNTPEVVREYTSRIPHLKLIENKQNHGKGWVVRKGMTETHGDYKLFMDADSSTSIDQIENFWPYTKEGYDVVIGSIEVSGAKVKENAQWYRRFLGHLSKYLIRIVAGLWEVHDSQRGFKLFSAQAAKDIFSRTKIDRFGFDIEVLALAKKFKHKIKEVGVIWNNPGESSVGLKSYVATFVDLMRVRLNLWSGAYNKHE